MNALVIIFWAVALLGGLCIFPVAARAARSGKKLPKIVVLGTGGTIAGKAASATELTAYAAGVLTPEQLLQDVPSLGDIAAIQAEHISSIDSSDMTADIWLKLAQRVNDLLAGDTAGVVITHGTDTMEETAYFLNLVVKSHKPVVLVGAMRPASAISADGPLNLLHAVTVAASEDAANRGVMVVLSGEINGARDVAKTNTTHVETFHSPNFGPLGGLINNTPVFYRQATRKHTVDSEFDVSQTTQLPKVAILYGYVGVTADALHGVLAGKPGGIVFAGAGNGTVPTGMAKELAKAAGEGVVVMRSSRVGSGMVSAEKRYDETLHLLAADSLSPQKARILLMLALTKTNDLGEITRMFKTY